MISVCTRKPPTILFLFTLEHCIEHVYFGLCQSTHMVNKKFKHFVTYLRRNCIIDKCGAANILRKIYDTLSNIECELIAYALDNIVYELRSMKNKLKIRLKMFHLFSPASNQQFKFM